MLCLPKSVQILTTARPLSVICRHHRSPFDLLKVRNAPAQSTNRSVSKLENELYFYVCRFYMDGLVTNFIHQMQQVHLLFQFGTHHLE
jgi:hypothetical protein